jgi:hypothetical protein
VAIVTDEAGMTRDVLEALDLGGYPVLPSTRPVYARPGCGGA